MIPPAPVRRRRGAPANDDQDLIAPPAIPNRRSKIDKEKSPCISISENGTGVRNVGVSVDIRPGYAHASTQTDPVQTCDFAI